MSRNETDKTAPAPSQRQRIAKLMARVGLCSRREAETWIVDGRVSVNGTVLTSPAIDVAPDDKVVVDGVPLPAAEKTRLFLFHKPRGLVTSDHDPEGRPTVADYLHEHWPDGPRVVTIGRLDINTEGLLLLTNDGGLARLLELPQTGWVRRYRVRAKGVADVATLDTLAEGVTIDGIDYAGIEAKLDRTQGANCWLTMGLREGKNREIKRVLEHIGLEVNRLIRLSFGPFQLLDLPEGAVEEVRTRVLRDQLGESLAARAGVDFGDAPATEPVRDRDTTRRSQSEPRGARTERAPRRPDPRRSDKPSTGHRQDRRDDRRPGLRDAERDAPPPKRERPATGTRKHVSTLRADEAETSKRGPRKRIERSDAQVRGDRTITVERLVSTRPAATTNQRRRPVRDDLAAAERPQRGERPPRRGKETAERSGPGRERHDGARGRGAHASPSALGKRERIARSGGGRHERSDPDQRPDRDERRGPPGQGRQHRGHQDRGRPDRERPSQGREDRGRQDRGRQDRDRQDRRDVDRDARPARSGPPRDKRPTAGRSDTGAPRRGAPKSSGDGRESRGKGAGTTGRPPKSGGGRNTPGRPPGKPPGRGPNGGAPRGPSRPKR